MKLTAAMRVWLWAYSPAAVLLSLTGLYGAAGVCLYRKLTGLLRDWQTLPRHARSTPKGPHMLKKNLE